MGEGTPSAVRRSHEREQDAAHSRARSKRRSSHAETPAFIAF